MAIQAWIDHGDHPVEQIVTKRQFADHFSFIAATLPFKDLDIGSAKERAAVYYGLMKGYTEPGIAYLVRRACAEFEWFPTPRQCLDILASYRGATTDVQQARLNLREFAEMEMGAFHARLRAGSVDQYDIDRQPSQWLRIGENIGLLRWDNGRFVQRGHKKTPPEGGV